MLLLKSLRRKIPAMLLYVVESKGSSPGRQGFFMAVNAKEVMEGSIGGGIMEHKFVELAKESLTEVTGLQANVKKQYHDKQAVANQSGMICSGEQTILLYRVQETDRKSIRQLIRSLKRHKNGTLTLSPAGIRFETHIPEINFYFEMKNENEWLYREKTGYKQRLSIIGGGHCALALSNLMSNMDFYISVYDTRSGLKTMKENKAAHEKHILKDYEKLKKRISAGDNHYVVIMTFGYRTDDTALRSLVGKNFKYLGLLGSKSKIEKMFEEYRKERIDEDWLNRIHTPIGVPIKSETPEEIAVSIAAEIINVKNHEDSKTQSGTKN